MFFSIGITEGQRGEERGGGGRGGGRKLRPFKPLTLGVLMYSPSV